jgi:5-methyltetrahydrofolate corrinoid/iron sulfur protein methyltransferase
MYVEIETPLCKAHGECVQVCPVEIIALNGKAHITAPEDCTDCGACIEICPEGAIVKKKVGLTIVAERINGTVKGVDEAIASRDEGHIMALAIRQAKGGADYLDVNAGTTGDKEIGDMVWLAETVQGVIDKPLSIDTTNPSVLREVLPRLNLAPMVNSVNADEARLEATLPLVKQYDAKLVALTVGPKNVPEALPKRLEYAKMIMDWVQEYEIPPNRIYFDPLILPLSVDTKTGPEFFETIKALKATYPATKSICGLSNVSFGMPQRKFLNQTFVVAAMANGLDAAILDTLDKRIMLTVIGAQALLGMDPNAAVYKKIFAKMTKRR